jgi:hypothetical protein
MVIRFLMPIILCMAMLSALFGFETVRPIQILMPADIHIASGLSLPS